jgi:two-component system, OmpR family, sensor kinase
MLLAEEHAAREAAERTMNMQDDFLSIAAHELRTPITPISMQLQLIKRVITSVNENQMLGTMKEKLLRITHNSNKELDRLSNLIDELLDVSRISAGRLLLNLEEINLSEIVQVLVNRHQIAAHNAGINLQLKLEPEVIGLWDSTRLESLVENLITNAIKYGDGKPVEVKLETREKNVVLTVKDYGIGISKEDQHRIFKKFERAASVKDYAGLGLGLYISSEIVKAHGGSIKLESAPQRGSTFLVELPLKANLS